jgi:hypothetical protein
VKKQLNDNERTIVLCRGHITQSPRPGCTWVWNKSHADYDDAEVIYKHHGHKALARWAEQHRHEKVEVLITFRIVPWKSRKAAKPKAKKPK